MTAALFTGDLSILSNHIAADDGADRQALALHANKSRNLIYIQQGLAGNLPFLLRIQNHQISVKANADIALLSIDAECLSRLLCHCVCQHGRGNTTLDTALIEGNLHAALDAADAAPDIKDIVDLLTENFVELLIIGTGRTYVLAPPM